MMFVKSIMKPPHECLTAQIGEDLKSVISILEHHDIQAVPVLDGSFFIGMLSKEIIYKRYFESNQPKDVYLSEFSAGDLVEKEDL
ncbi:hypothetical protein SAMN05421743_10679 [Thalassobacillus cyri]|uniref:CBS domain-containing protein n=2 Tax=Thalassobacillus cyri TaxID=571932 RepID=A0A1H4CKC2_9BACI|nr:hypothetical protein SAMN05421743_10679 [Thalassobacillus cyri]